MNLGIQRVCSVVKLVNAGDEARFVWIRHAGGIDNLDASIPLALGFIGSDEWEILALEERDRVAWIEASEFSTVALVEVLMKMEAWSRGGPPIGGTDTDEKLDNRRYDSLRRKTQRKLDSMSDDPALLERTSPGHWKVKSEEYKKYCTIRFEVSRKMDEGWSTVWHSESSNTAEPAYEPDWRMQYERNWRMHTGPVEQYQTTNLDAHAGNQARWSKNKVSSVKMQELIERVKARNEPRHDSSSQLYRSFVAKRQRDSRNAAHFSWERQLNHRFRRLTVGIRDAGAEIWHLDFDLGGETTKDEPGEREWPLKSIPEPARDKEGRFEIGSKKMKWRIHVSILEIMTKVREDRNLENRPWITRGVISDALLESGEKKTEGRISQVLGDLVGLRIIEKKSHKDDGRIKLYRVKDGFLLRKQKNKDKTGDELNEELAAFMDRLDIENADRQTELNETMNELIEEIQSIG